jgi:hypothetical protein
MNFKDTIGVFDNVLSKTNCKRYISRLEDAIKEGHASPGKPTSGDSEEIKKSTDFNFLNLTNNRDAKLVELIVGTFNNYLTNEYLNKFPYNDEFIHNSVVGDKTKYPAFNIQKYDKNKGHYNGWHVEKDCLATSNRAFVFILYLNDVEEGGETEFLFDDNGGFYKVSPKAGRLVIHPASWPYIHRGTMPKSNDKYIVTSWLNFSS